MLASLLLVVCLAGSDKCQTIEPFNQVTFQDCILGAQLGAKQWLEEHPKWELKEMRCVVGKKGEDI